MDFFVKILVWGGVNKWKWVVFFSKIWSYTSPTIRFGRVFKMRHCIMGETRRHFVISLFLALIWKFLTKCGNVNSIFHSDRISADNNIETDL